VRQILADHRAARWHDWITGRLTSAGRRFGSRS